MHRVSRAAYREQGLLSSCGVQSVSVSGFSCCTAQAPGKWVSLVAACGLSRGGSPAQLLLSMWNLPGPGIEPVSPALAGRLLSTISPEKSHTIFYLFELHVLKLFFYQYRINVHPNNSLIKKKCIKYLSYAKYWVQGPFPSQQKI